MTSSQRIRRLLIANRGEISIRVQRAAAELGIRTMAVYSQEDRFSLHRFKADEAYLVGKGLTPVQAYLDIGEVLRVAQRTRSQAIHPGYGFLAENPQFARACIDAGLIWVGPPPAVMDTLGNKVAARALAERAGVPVMPASPPLPRDPARIRELAAAIGFPLMVKATWGGGGRGTRVVREERELIDLVTTARNEAATAFGNDEVYLEKLVERARHVEVQIIGDAHGNLVHLFERDCTVQRRHQKVVERAPAIFLDPGQREELCGHALKLGRAAGYVNAGTVEFLQDVDTGRFYFIEVNPRVQVEHTVTENVTGIDIVKAQILIAGGGEIGSMDSGVPQQDAIRLNGHAMQCRITTEDPENGFIPDYGVISAYRSPAGFGIRLDAGTAYAGARITRYYDSLLVKVTAWGVTPQETVARMRRALAEFRIRGVRTNLVFLESLMRNPRFRNAEYTTTFIDDTPELLRFRRRRDRVTRLLNFVSDVIVNGNVEVAGRTHPPQIVLPKAPELDGRAVPDGSRQRLEALGPEKFAHWMRAQQRVLVTDTTFRDAHQSLIATRMRTHDMAAIAPVYARLLPDLLSVECWGGATFDVALRFLKECPWERLALLRERLPNVLLQMLLRAANGVGYTNYPDNVVAFFVREAARAGVDLFRVFDSLNWIENMRPAMDAVLETGKLCEAAICYTGDLSDPACTKYDLKYYVGLARELERAGAHILAIKDMAGLCRPRAASMLVRTLREEIGLPIHFHTHDTSGIAAASVLAAIDAGCDAVDAAVDSMSGLTSQPNLGSIVEALRHDERSTGIDPEHLRVVSRYFEQVRSCYGAFESDIRSGASEVYVHGMPGGQYTNLREQARALGLAERWADVAGAYAEVNDMFGDIVKVTPTSKVVGDMALMMVTSGLTRADVLDPESEIAFPESVVSFFRGDLGQPYGGFPASLQRKVLKGEAPLERRPGAVLAAVDLEAVRAEVAHKAERRIGDQQLASYLMYPKVFLDWVAARRHYGDISVLPTPVFFYGMEPGQEISVDVEPGKAVVIRFVTMSDPHEDGSRTVFYEVNGQPRSVSVSDRALAPEKVPAQKAEAGNSAHVGAPMPGLVATVCVATGERVSRGDLLLTIEAMKMEAGVRAERDGRVKEVLVQPGQQIDVKDLLLVLKD
ncbi:MAG: pyruvate carboxylase [Gammaproteobacteria bacterium]|nr:pyruvate carboxylase [Gammaproteobacteria bacterium]